MKVTIISILWLIGFNLSLFANYFTLGYESFQKKDYVKAKEYYKKACDGK